MSSVHCIVVGTFARECTANRRHSGERRNPEIAYRCSVWIPDPCPCRTSGMTPPVGLALRSHCCYTHAFRPAPPSVNSYELFIGLRYTRSRQRTRFISVISLISIVGIALGMTVLITVLSVFNGFQREVRTRMLSAVAHIQVSGHEATLSVRQGVT